MEPMIENWAKRYYYTGLHLAAPAQLPENPKYGESFKQLLSDPISKLLNESLVSTATISQFLQSYQQLGVKSPFYNLKYFADTYEGGDWMEHIQNAISSLDLVTAVVKDGKAFHTYAQKNRVVGTYPKTAHVLGPDTLCRPGEDIINILLFNTNPLITDIEVEALRRICKMSQDYEKVAAEHGIEMEHVRGGAFYIEKISPTSSFFPPYNVRKLFNSLPMHSDYLFKHEQAYNYITTASSALVEPGVKEYLEGALKATETPQATQEVNPKPEDHRDEDGNQIPLSQFTIPEDSVKFEDVGDLLSYLVSDGTLLENWSIADIIKWYNLPSSDPFYPRNTFQFDKNPVCKDNKAVLLEILGRLGEVIDLADTKAMTIQHLIRELKEDKEGVSPQNPHELLKQMLVICASKGTRDVTSIKNNEREWGPQLVRQAQEAINKGYSGELTLQEAADGKSEHSSEVSSDDLAMLAYKASLPDALTIGDLKNGITEPISIMSVGGLLGLPQVSDKVKNELFRLQGIANKLKSITSANELLATDLLPTEANISLAQALNKSENESELGILAASRSSAIDKAEGLQDLLKWGVLTDKLAGDLRELLEPRAKISTLEELLQSDAIDAGLKKTLISTGEKKSAMSLEELLGFEDTATTVKAEYEELKNFNQSVKSAASLNELLAGNYLSKELSDELVEMMKGTASTGAEQKASYSGDDFGYAVAETLLSGVREWLHQFDGKPVMEVVRTKLKAVPIYYAFVRVCGSSADSLAEIEEYLNEVLNKVDEEVKSIVQSGLDVLQNYK